MALGFLLNSCETRVYRVLEGTSWRITDYTINGADSMASVIAFHLEGEFRFLERTGYREADLRITTIAHDTTYYHQGTWDSQERKAFEIIVKSLVVGPGIMPKGDYRGNYNKLSYRPFRSTNWKVKKLTQKNMELELTLDNREYYLQFKSFKL